MNTYLDVVCYRSKILADGTSPIMLRLTKDGKRKYISLHLSANQSNWDFKKNTPKRNCPERDAILSVIERKSKQYREQITQFKVEGKDYTLETLVQRVENPVSQKNFAVKVVEMLDIALKKQTWIPSAKVKSELQKIYDSLGIKRTAKATDIDEWYEVERGSRYIDGRNTRCVMILRKTFISLKNF